MPEPQSNQNKTSEQMLHELMLKMIEFDAGDTARIQHFVKVASFARTIALGEGMDAQTLLTLEAAAIVHDIGIRPSEEKYGDPSGKHQEELGPEPARRMLAEVGFDPARCERVAYLVGHHHTYTNIDGADYQVLVEADFLVNLFENGSGLDAVRSAGQKIFRTATGKWLLETMFDVRIDG
ncbi:HD domain-containing protein [Paratractidigestivibacter sp.]|nr:HD domain-containing protein [Paratractidigestivibacter sp.]